MSRRKQWRARLATDDGSATAEYAIATMAAVNVARHILRRVKHVCELQGLTPVRGSV